MGILSAIGGKVKSVAKDATAYVDGDSNSIFELECAGGPVDKPEVAQAQRTWLNSYFAAMQPLVQKEAYVNCPTRDLPDWADAYYGTNLPRLRKIKSKYDPQNVFTFAQSIPQA